MSEQEGELLPLQQALVISITQMFHSLQFEQLTIPVVLGLLCGTHHKVAVLPKSLHLCRNKPILHLSMLYAVPNMSIIISFLSLPMHSVVLHKYRICKYVLIFLVLQFLCVLL